MTRPKTNPTPRNLRGQGRKRTYLRLAIPLAIPLEVVTFDATGPRLSAVAAAIGSTEGYPATLLRLHLADGRTVEIRQAR